MRLIAKAVIVAATTGAAAMFTAPAASSQTEISNSITINSDVLVLAIADTVTTPVPTPSPTADSISTTIDYDIADLAVSITLGGHAFAATEPDTGVVAEVTLPVEQHLVTAQNTETGYRIDLLPDNGTGNSVAQQRQSAAAIQVPVQVPVNACGNTINIVGALNPAFGNVCENG